MSSRRKGIDRSWIDDLKPDEIRALEEQALLPPDCNGLPLSIRYSDRADSDYVLSGPLGSGRARGRHFASIEEAVEWATKTFGTRLKIPPHWNQSEANPMWLCLVRTP